MAIRAMWYWHDNEEWYIWDDEKGVFFLTEKAPQKAIESFKKWQNRYSEPVIDHEAAINETIKTVLLGHAVGDALGVPVEFYDRKRLEEKPVTDMVGYLSPNSVANTWSDDTSMSLCLIDSINRKGCIDYEDIMNNFVRWINEGVFTPDGQAFGIGKICLKAILAYIRNKDSLFTACTSEKENGNGSLMRIFPACIYVIEKDIPIDDAMNIIHNLSALTHGHSRSKMACGIYFFIFKSIYEEAFGIDTCIELGLESAKKYYEGQDEFSSELVYYERLFDKDFRSWYLDEFRSLDVSEIKSSGYVVDSLEAAIWCLLNSDSYKETVLKAVNLGGDTDTIAAIAGGLAALHYGKEDIPSDWIELLRAKDVLGIA